jgi:hypothetical protein
MSPRLSAKVVAFVMAGGAFGLTAAGAEPTTLSPSAPAAYTEKEFFSMKHFRPSWKTCCEPTDLMSRLSTQGSMGIPPPACFFA